MTSSWCHSYQYGWLKIKTNLIKLVLNTFISIKGPIILQNCPILSPSEPDQLIQVIRGIWTPSDSPRFYSRLAPARRPSRFYWFELNYIPGLRAATEQRVDPKTISWAILLIWIKLHSRSLLVLLKSRRRDSSLAAMFRTKWELWAK